MQFHRESEAPAELLREDRDNGPNLLLVVSNLPLALQQSQTMNQSHPAGWSEEELLSHCKLTFSRASGPGGQNRNKVETSVHIEFVPAELHAQASERRTQNENRKVAIQRLRCKLAVEYQPTRELAPPAPLFPSELWNRYCKDGRINVSDNNTEWPALLAELMNSLEQNAWNLSLVADGLATSSSQLVKLLKKYPPAFSRLNEARKLREQRPLT